MGTLAWSPQSSILASGSRDRKILLQDVKVKGNFDSAGSPFYSPYRSRTSPFSSRRHSSPAPIYSSREQKINSVFESGTVNLAAMPSPASPGMFVDLSGRSRDSPPLHEQVFHDVGSSGVKSMDSHEKSSWSIFDPDDVDDSSTTVPPIGHRIGTRDSSSSNSTKKDMPHLLSIKNDANSWASSSGNEMDVSDEEISEDDSSKICDPDGIFVGGSLLFCPRPPSPPSVPLHRPPSSSHSTPIRFGTRASYPSTSPHTSTAAPCRIRELLAHKQEVCGLKWSFDEKQLASGGNDNKLLVWNVAATGDEGKHCTGASQAIAPEFKFSDHTAAVKAIAWSPHQSGLLASGGIVVEY